MLVAKPVIPETPKALSGIVTNSGLCLLRSRISAKAFSGMTANPTLQPPLAVLEDGSRATQWSRVRPQLSRLRPFVNNELA